MIQIKSSELKRDIERYRDLALSEPVAIADSGEAQVIMISAQEYDRLKRRDRVALKAEDLTEAELKAIESVEAPEEAAAFDHETR